MNDQTETRLAYSTRDILAARGSKEPVDPWKPYAFFSEPECNAAGVVEDVATIFLTNRECPYRCLMCDLWKHTTDLRVPLGAIPAQIDYALSRLPTTRHVKLYNSGNFFDRQAIPVEDYAAIASRLQSFETVIVENHPNLCGSECIRFRDLLPGNFEVAMGLETIHPHVLSRLNKRMTVDDFARATRLLREADIHVRAFLLLRPPFLSEAEGLHWACQSLEFAFQTGVECCSVIPARAGNGMMERLAELGAFAPPSLSTLETVLAAGFALQHGRVFVDLWDMERLLACQVCGPARRDRLQAMNWSQKTLPPIRCGTCDTTTQADYFDNGSANPAASGGP